MSDFQFTRFIRSFHKLVLRSIRSSSCGSMAQVLSQFISSDWTENFLFDDWIRALVLPLSSSLFVRDKQEQRQHTAQRAMLTCAAGLTQVRWEQVLWWVKSGRDPTWERERRRESGAVTSEALARS